MKLKDKKILVTGGGGLLWRYSVNLGASIETTLREVLNNTNEWYQPHMVFPHNK